jgi:hypothetical protein
MLALKILGYWIALSLTVGPLFAWAFFHPMRREDEMRRRGWSNSFQRRCSVHQLRARSMIEQVPTVDESELGARLAQRGS